MSTLKKRLTEKMVQALRIAKVDGRVTAGLSVDHCGRSARVSAATIAGLVKRGRLSRAGELTVSGKQTLTLIESGHPVCVDIAMACGDFR